VAKLISWLWFVGVVSLKLSKNKNDEDSMHIYLNLLVLFQCIFD
jgi:hypothetical protein